MAEVAGARVAVEDEDVVSPVAQVNTARTVKIKMELVKLGRVGGLDTVTTLRKRRVEVIGALEDRPLSVATGLLAHGKTD